jgi:beta-phosphoglucomutase
MLEENINRYLNNHGFREFTPKAVLFDMDGVLFDSMPNHAFSWHASMEKYGLSMSPEEAYEHEGRTGVSTIKILARKQWHRELTDDEARRMYKTKSEIFSNRPKAKKMKGAENLLNKVKRDGKKIIVVTGSGQKTLLDNLQYQFPGLISSDLIVTSFDVTNGKPDPEPYIKGLAKAGVKPYEAIVVENAPLGVRAAVAADIFTVAVNTGPLPDSILLNEGANLLFPSMQAFCNDWDLLFVS